MVGSNWDRVLDNVRTFVDVRNAHAAGGGNRCRVTFQLTFLETNVPELPGIVKLAAELGVDRVKGHHLWVHFKQTQELAMRRSPEAIARWNDAVEAANTAASRHRLPDGSKVLLENIFKLDETATEEIAPDAVCPFLGQEAWVSAEGRFNPCCAPDVLRRTLGEFGNVNDVSLHDIWESDDYKNLETNYMQNALCRGCNMRRPTTS